MQSLVYVGIFSILQIISGDDVNIYLRTSDGVWGSYLGESKTLICQSNRYPLSSCNISVGTKHLKPELNLETGRCQATHYIHENHENELYSCQIRLKGEIKSYSSEPVRMKALNDRTFPSLQVDQLFPDSTMKIVKDTTMNLVKQSNLRLYCRFPVPSYKETKGEEYYVRWTVEVSRYNEIVNGRIETTTETLMISESGAGLSTGSVLTMIYHPVAYVEEAIATCALYHAAFGDKPLVSKRIIITQIYPTSLVRIANYSEIWSPEGNSVTLVCNADGNPAPSFRWVKKLSRTQSEPTDNGDGRRLVFSNLSVKDSGNYACRARNSRNPLNNWIESEEITVFVMKNGATTIVMNVFLVFISALLSVH